MAISSRVCFCSDRSGRRSFISIDLELYTCVSILYLFLPSAISLIIARFLQCIAASFLRTVILAAMGDQPTKEKRRNEYRYLWYFFYCALGLRPVLARSSETSSGYWVPSKSVQSLLLLRYWQILF